MTSIAFNGMSVKRERSFISPNKLTAVKQGSKKKTHTYKNGSREELTPSNESPDNFPAFFKAFGLTIEKKYLNALNDYSYKSKDYSLIANYILRYYWDWAASRFPVWMAPNLITLLGFSFIIAAYFLLILMCSDLKTELHPIFYVIFALFVWLNSTLDNVDGKQARRTNSSSPLGELFDHGCDSLCLNIVCAMQMASLGMGQNIFYIGVPMMLIGTFYLCTWETYHTGSLTLGYINGPTEGVLISVLLFILTSFYGLSFWDEVQFSLPINNSMYDFKRVDLLYSSFLFLFLVYQMPSCIISVAKNRKPTSSNKEVLLSLVPIVVFSFFYYSWAAAPYSNVFFSYPIFYISIFGIAFGRITTKIILAHVTSSPFPYFTVMLIPLFIGTVLANYWTRFIEFEVVFLCLCLSFLLSAYTIWVYAVIQQLCRFLKINCFSLKRKEK